MSDDWLIMKRDLYFRPEGKGYTGIRDEAGVYSYEDAHSYHDCTAIRMSDAPEFTAAAFNDLVIKHLIKQRDEARTLAQQEQEPQAWQRRNIGADGKPWSSWYMADDEPTPNNMKFDGYYSYEYRPLYALPSTERQPHPLKEATQAQHFDTPKGEPARFVRNGVLETCQCRDCAAISNARDDCACGGGNLSGHDSMCPENATAALTPRDL